MPKSELAKQETRTASTIMIGARSPLERPNWDDGGFRLVEAEAFSLRRSYLGLLHHPKAAQILVRTEIDNGTAFVHTEHIAEWK